MKLQSIAIVFTIIILPMVIILTYYIQMQVDTIALQASYDSKLFDATHDAMSAFEINTANEDLSAVSDSLRSIIEATNSIFFNTLATNFGMSNASQFNLEPYVPAILYTLYDGYYIYSPTEQPIIIKHGYTYEARGDSATEIADTSYEGTDNGQPVLNSEGNLQYLKKDGSFTSNILDPDIVYREENLLKSYMPYSARYVTGNIDVTINYTLDNYLNIVGNVNNVYYTKTGYLINPNMLVDVQEDGRSIKDTILNFNENTAEEYVLSNKHNLTVVLSDNGVESRISMTKDDNSTIAQKKEALTKEYEDYQEYYVNYRNAYNTVNAGGLSAAEQASSEDKLNEAQNLLNNSVARIRNLEYEIQNAEAVAYYIRSTIFSKWVYANLSSIRECDIREELSAINEASLTTTNSEKLGDGYKDIFYKFSDKTDNIFVEGEDTEGDSNFTNHKDQVIRNSIQYNLNLAFSTYSKMSDGEFTFEMPILSDTEWSKIVRQVSVLAFMQGMPCGTKMYSNYALVSSSNNELTVIPEEIYYVEKDKFNDETTICHRIDCPEFDPSDSVTDYIAFTAKEIKYDKIYNQQNNIYEYDHKNLLCYNCIINKNYLKDESDENSYVEGMDLNSLSNNKKTAYYRAIGALREGLYKTNALTKSEGYDKIYEGKTPRTFNSGSNTINLQTERLERTLGEAKGIQIVLENVKSNDVRETTVNFEVIINGTVIGTKALAVSNYSRNQTIDLEIDPNLFRGSSATNINVTLRRNLTNSTISLNETYVNIIYK